MHACVQKDIYIIQHVLSKPLSTEEALISVGTVIKHNFIGHPELALKIAAISNSARLSIQLNPSKDILNRLIKQCSTI